MVFRDLLILRQGAWLSGNRLATSEELLRLAHRAVPPALRLVAPKRLLCHGCRSCWSHLHLPRRLYQGASGHVMPLIADLDYAGCRTCIVLGLLLLWLSLASLRAYFRQAAQPPDAELYLVGLRVESISTDLDAAAYAAGCGQLQSTLQECSSSAL